MIKFFKDVLDGPLYFIIAILAIILIMAIIGFMMERKQKEIEAENKIAHVDRNVTKKEENPAPNSDNGEIPVFNPMEDENTETKE